MFENAKCHNDNLCMRENNQMKTEAAMKRILIFTLITLSWLTLYCQNAIRPSVGDGSPDNPYRIETMGNLFWAYCSEEHWDKAFIQTEDIDASETSGWFQGTGWLPIGVYVGIDDPGNMPFTGSYDGQNHAISNLFINRPDGSYSGLFGYVTGAEIRNVDLVCANVTGDRCVGGLAGVIMDGCVLDHCSMTGQADGNDNVGGLVGYGLSCEVGNCSVECSVSGCAASGGLIGFAWEMTVENCSAVGEVRNATNQGGLIGDASHSVVRGCTCDSELYDGSVCGGILGKGSSNLLTDCSGTSISRGCVCSGGMIGRIDEGEVRNCFCDTRAGGEARRSADLPVWRSARIFHCAIAAVPVDGTGVGTGGFTGFSNDSNYQRCYSLADVIGEEGVGGFIGYMLYNEVRDCFSMGDVSGSLKVGGFLGSGVSGHEQQ